ncbi:MAG: 2-dehydropantoate 2-reductase N-terminal domain-containing protein [bacterium]
MQKLAFVGAGRWATALACGLNQRFDAVALYDCDADAVERLRTRRVHHDLPDSTRLPDAVVVTADPAAVLAGADFVVFAVPAAAIDAAGRAVATLVPAEATVVSVTKGFDPQSGERLS